LLIIFSYSVSVMFGITGIIFDKSKLLAIIVTAAAVMPIILYLYLFVLTV